MGNKKSCGLNTQARINKTGKMFNEYFKFRNFWAVITRTNK